MSMLKRSLVYVHDINIEFQLSQRPRSRHGPLSHCRFYMAQRPKLLGKDLDFCFKPRDERVILLMEVIRRSPVEVGSVSHYLQGFSTIPGGKPPDF